MKLSFDSSALIKLVLQEQGWKAVERVVSTVEKDDADTALMAGPVLTEVIFRSRAKGNVRTGQQIASALLSRGLRLESATEPDLIRAADLLEVSSANPGPPRNPHENGPALSLADATIIAISERVNAKIITGDKHWKWMVDEGLIDGIDIVTIT